MITYISNNRKRKRYGKKHYHKLNNNKHNTTLLNKIPLQKKQKNSQGNLKSQKTKWVTFTYSGKEVLTYLWSWALLEEPLTF
jgi:hypothetical protein